MNAHLTILGPSYGINLKIVFKPGKIFLPLKKIWLECIQFIKRSEAGCIMYVYSFHIMVFFISSCTSDLTLPVIVLLIQLVRWYLIPTVNAIFNAAIN